MYLYICIVYTYCVSCSFPCPPLEFVRDFLSLALCKEKTALENEVKKEQDQLTYAVDKEHLGFKLRI